MKGILNFLFILVIICSICLYAIDISMTNSLTFLLTALILSLIGIALNVIFVKNENIIEEKNSSKIMTYVVYVIFTSALITITIHSFTIDNLMQKVKDLFKEEEVVISTVIDIYEIENEFKVTFDYSINEFTVFRKDEKGKINSYAFSIFELDEFDSENVRRGYHGKIDFKCEKEISIYGIFEYLDEGESFAKPYIEIDKVMYSVHGNSLIMNEVFTKIFSYENILKNNVLSIQAVVLNLENNKKENQVVEEYYMDDEFRYLYNGERVYKDLYICPDYSISTYSKMSKYINDMGLQKQKEPSKIIGKEIKVNNDYISKVRLYYYNNLDSINFIELIFKDKKESIIFKESNAKFKYDDILKLY